MPIPSRSRIGFVGLGDQGAPMAGRVLAAGFPLTFYARRTEVVERFVALGGHSAESLKALGAAADIVGIVVVDDDQVREVVGSGEDSGLLAGMAPGSVIVIHSTVSPRVCREIGALAGKRGVKVVDAPVSGGSPRAESGTLTVMVGGDAESFAHVEPVCATFGSVVRHVGALGAGQLTKLINNYMFAAHAAVAEQSAMLIRGFDLDIDMAADLLKTGSGVSAAFAMAADRHFERPQHQKGFDYALTVLAKDVRLLRAEADERGIALDLTRDFIDRGLVALGQTGSSTTEKK